MYITNPPISCGIACCGDFDRTGRNWTKKEAKELAEYLYLESWSNTSTLGREAFVMTSDIPNSPSERFIKYLKRRGFITGRIQTSLLRTNLNSGNKIKVWIGAINNKAFRSAYICGKL